MAENSKIEWTDHTFNPWIGCTKVSPACDNCYAAQQDKFRKWTPEGWGGPRKRTSEANWRQPMKWDKEAHDFFKQHGRRQRVFCASLADVFDNQVPREWRYDLLMLIANTPCLDWLLLTKRIGNAANMLEDIVSSWRTDPFSNVWLGATIANQEEADRDIPKLLATPARIRFLSMEPLLGPVDLRMGGASIPDYAPHRPLPQINWIITGGESGPGARPSHPDWFRSLRDQCAAAGVPFLFKQWGDWWESASNARDEDGQHFEVDASSLEAAEWFDDGDLLISPDGRTFTLDTLPEETRCRHMVRLGKKAAGRELDGRTWDGFPK